jgi:hypothetical protein
MTIFQVLPYIINDKLVRKSKQPKFVSRDEVQMDLNNEFAGEHITRNVCGRGTYPPGIEETTFQYATCRLLHNYNPYLRK